MSEHDPVTVKPKGHLRSSMTKTKSTKGKKINDVKMRYI
jgi:hypothetical protein